MEKTVTCRRCRRKNDPISANCRRCGSPLRVTDPRVCPYCGKLKDPFLEKCEKCEDSYVPPSMRSSAPTPPPENRNTAVCPNCGNMRPPDDKPCPWCGSKLLPLAPG